MKKKWNLQWSSQSEGRPKAQQISGAIVVAANRLNINPHINLWGESKTYQYSAYI